MLRVVKTRACSGPSLYNSSVLQLMILSMKLIGVLYLGWLHRPLLSNSGWQLPAEVPIV